MTDDNHFKIFSKDSLINGRNGTAHFTTYDLLKLIEEAVYQAMKRLEADKTKLTIPPLKEVSQKKTTTKKKR
jgi:hypothetical protein